MFVWVIVFIATLWFAIPEVILKESDRRKKSRGDAEPPKGTVDPQRN